MTAADLPPPVFGNLRPNPDWASLPIFSRVGWERVRFGDVVENVNETCAPAGAGIERVIAMEHLEPGSLHVRARWSRVGGGSREPSRERLRPKRGR